MAIETKPAVISGAKAYDIERMLIESKRELLKQGLENGKRGVYAAFAAFGVVYISDFILYCLSDKVFIAAPFLLGFAGVLSIALIIYFGFIFGYSFYLTADFDKKQLEVRTENFDEDAQSKHLSAIPSSQIHSLRS